MSAVASARLSIAARSSRTSRVAFSSTRAAAPSTRRSRRASTAVAMASAAPASPPTYLLLTLDYVEDILEKRDPYRAEHIAGAKAQEAAANFEFPAQAADCCCWWGASRRVRLAGLLRLSDSRRPKIRWCSNLLINGSLLLLLLPEARRGS